MNDHICKPVSSAELNELEDFLLSGGASRTAMDLDMLDGFFAALASGPETLEPEQWQPLVWGPEEEAAPELGSMEQMQRVLSIMVRYKQLVESVLLCDPASYQPLFRRCSFADPAEERVAAGNWAKGFLIGMEPVRETWQPLFEEDTEFSAFAPVFMLAGIGGEGEIETEQWYRCRDAVAESVRAIHRFWMPFRGKTGRVSTARSDELRHEGPTPECSCRRDQDT
ncbi:MAG: UPF0149 family protein [Chlorobi bacterium]|nr:UPF0149 family protein [Chlorobiota bacterium]